MSQIAVQVGVFFKKNAIFFSFSGIFSDFAPIQAEEATCVLSLRSEGQGKLHKKSPYCKLNLNVIARLKVRPFPKGDMSACCRCRYCVQKKMVVHFERQQFVNESIYFSIKTSHLSNFFEYLRNNSYLCALEN